MHKQDKILNLMQFARKAGKVIGGSEACMRAVERGNIHLLIIASDAAGRTLKRIERHVEACQSRVKILPGQDQKNISAALGMPDTAVFGISDKNFAAKMIEYWQN